MNRRSYIISFLLIGILLFFSFRVTRISEMIATLFSYTAYPFLVIQNVVISPVKNYINKQHSIAQLQQEVIKLRKDKKELLQELIEMHSLVWFYQATRELIDYKKQYCQTDMELAQIIYKHLGLDEHFYLINRGSHHGITPDMVAVHKNYLIGRVSNVYPYYSKVVLITDKSCKVASYATKSGTQGISEGILDKNVIKLKYVNHLNSIHQHDIVLSSGQGLVFPKGYGLGSIEQFHLDGLFYDISIKPFLNWDDIEYCYIMQRDS